MEGNKIYFGEVQKKIHRSRVDSVFFPGTENLFRIAVLHEYIVCKEVNNEEMI